MKTRISRILVTTLLTLGMLSSGMISSQKNAEAAAPVKLAKSSITLVEGKTQTIQVKASKKVTIKKTTYSSKDKKIATVTKKGKVTGKSAGNTKITVKVTYKKSGKKSTKNLTCKVKVTGASYKYKEYANMSAEEIVAGLTLDQKVTQMLQPACYELPSVDQLKEKCYGSVLSKLDFFNDSDWRGYITALQKAAVASKAGIPIVYGQDDVHGVNYCTGAMYFPHNIGLGAANDPDLMYKMGQITADEAKLCLMLWNFSPCVAQSVDPRWGRTYESFGSDLNIIKSLSKAYVKGMQDNGLIACAKHFLADGNVKYGTGEKSDEARLIDRGDAVLSEAEINDLLSVYKELIDAGVKTIMISHSSLNGVKMHENKTYIDKLKNDMGFQGFIVSDWDSIQNIPKDDYYQQLVAGINAGIDMLMEVDRFDEAIDNIINAVKNGDIDEKRIDDAVTRIIRVKKEADIISDPFGEKIKTTYSTTGSREARDVAEQLVKKSLVLMKNDNNLLPLKKGQKIYITGPAAASDQAQCGGWTIDWNGSPEKDIEGVTNIREGFEAVAAEKGITIVDDPAYADLVVLCVGESAYAEWNGDSENPELCGPQGLEGNAEAIEEAQIIDKPVVTCIVAGRNVYIDKYEKNWDSIVMCYLPGSEGQGVAKMLCGDGTFTGKLPSNWYASNAGFEKNEPWRKAGYGLTY